MGWRMGRCVWESIRKHAISTGPHCSPHYRTRARIHVLVLLEPILFARPLGLAYAAANTDGRSLDERARGAGGTGPMLRGG